MLNRNFAKVYIFSFCSTFLPFRSTFFEELYNKCEELAFLNWSLTFFRHFFFLPLYIFSLYILNSEPVLVQ